MTSKSPDCRLRGIEASLVLFASHVNGIKEPLPSGTETYIRLLSRMLDDEKFMKTLWFGAQSLTRLLPSILMVFISKKFSKLQHVGQSCCRITAGISEGG
jgi:hypothetical protein